MSNRYRGPWVAMLLLTAIYPAQSAHAWSSRGHQVVCEAAVFLVKDAALRTFLQGRLLTMSYLCNVPDTQWRGRKSAEGAAADASHYLAWDLIATTTPVEANYETVLQQFHAKHPDMDAQRTLGANWWRAKQFYDRAIALKTAFERTTPPTEDYLQDTEQPFNQAVLAFVTNLGVMGHFVGDNSQPLHLMHDYDGYASGHGGLHHIYENNAVNAQPAELLDQVVRQGRQLQQQRTTPCGTVLSCMQQLGTATLADKDQVIAWDVVTSPSKPGTPSHKPVPARRPDIASHAAAAQTLIVGELARGAVTLAELWDSAFAAVGRPPFDQYQSYQFPEHVDFVPTHYTD